MILPDAHGGGILKEKDHVRSHTVLEAIHLSRFQDLNEGEIKKSSKGKVDKACLLRGAETLFDSQEAPKLGLRMH